MKKVIDKYGTIYYYNDKGELHREDGPAAEYTDGEKRWCKNGFCHREDGHAVEYVDGTKEWYKNGLLHREDGPAVEYTNGNKEYWYNDIMYPNIKSNEEWARFVKLIIFK